MPGRDGHTTIDDIARAAGVSVATVSRVLNGKPDVSPRTKENVYRAMEHAGYTANPIARSLGGARTWLLGFHARDFSFEYTIAVMRGILEVSEQAKYGLLLSAAHDTFHNPATQLLRSLHEGLIVMSSSLESAAELDLFDSNRPLVLVEPLAQQPNRVVVTAANQDGIAQVVRYLVSLGHRRIGFISGPLTLVICQERLNGFRLTLDATGIATDTAGIVEGQLNEDGGRVGALQLLTQRNRPTAIVASNDLQAAGVYQAARALGLRIPEDVSVTGFDDIPLAEHLFPTLTTVQQPLREIGRQAALILIRWIEGARPEVAETVLSTHLVVRGSCAPLVTHDGI